MAYAESCDPGRPAGKCPTECFLSAFGHLPRSAPKSAFEYFLAFLGLKQGARQGGRTLRKGVFLPSKHLLSAFYNIPPF